MTETETYETIDSLRQALPWLPTGAVIRDRDGGWLDASGVPSMSGYYAPYTVTYEVPDTPASEARPGFTLGQKVRRTGPDHHLVRRGEFYHVSRQSGRGVTLEGLGDYTYYAAEFEAVDESPAPLDPSKVKAGDTVTVHVEMGDVKVAGRRGMRQTVGSLGSYDVMGEVWEDYSDNPHSPLLRVGTYWLNSPEVILTDHQPAPEPEPEWKAGTVADITVDFDTHRAIRAEIGVWRTVGTESFTDSRVDEVKPLVVIDPAKVDVDAIATKAFTSVSMVERVFEAIGLEAS